MYFYNNGYRNLFQISVLNIFFLPFGIWCISCSFSNVLNREFKACDIFPTDPGVRGRTADPATGNSVQGQRHCRSHKNGGNFYFNIEKYA